MPEGWDWDETLYAGSAAYYERGRLPYPARLADAATAALDLDGTGRLIDVGCGPGIVAIALAHLFEEVVGVDADGGMLAVAATHDVANATWIEMRAEDLPGDLGRFRVATFAQSFHWMDRDRVAAAIFDMLEPGGAFVLVNHWSMLADEGPEHPLPPYDDIKDLVAKYMGSTPRAGQGVLRYGTPSNEEAVLARVGFDAPSRVPVPAGDVVVTTVDDIIARYFSASASAPHLFGSQLDHFVRDLTALLLAASPSGQFAERVRDAELVVWRKPSFFAEK